MKGCGRAGGGRSVSSGGGRPGAGWAWPDGLLSLPGGWAWSGAGRRGPPAGAQRGADAVSSAPAGARQLAGGAWPRDALVSCRAVVRLPDCYWLWVDVLGRGETPPDPGNQWVTCRRPSGLQCLCAAHRWQQSALRKRDGPGISRLL